MVDYIADYLENIRDRRVFPDVRPGYMKNLLPESAPNEGEEWNVIFNDIERVVMPGITHWQSPHMHAYFPALNSFPSLLGDMLADAINCLGFTWVWIENLKLNINKDQERLLCLSGIIASLYRIRDDHNELAWQNDWIARLLSAYKE